MSAGRRPYSPPTIRRHEVGLANRFTTPRGRGVVDSIDGQAVESLAREHGSPLFVFSERTLRERAQGRGV